MATTRECPSPFQVGVDNVAQATNIFRYKSNAIVDAGRRTITLQPLCVANTKNMCPELLSGGAPCRTDGSCTFDFSNCTSMLPEGVCTYKMDLLKDMRDVAFLLRSSGSSNNAQIPISMTTALISDLSRRLESMGRDDAVKFGMQADAWCIGPRRKALQSFHANIDGDHANVKDRWGTNWSGIHWSQSRWLASVMSKPISAGPSAYGHDCYVKLGCDVGSEWPDVLAEIEQKLSRQ